MKMENLQNQDKIVSKKPISLVIFGGTGDLTKRKLVPALAGLVEDGAISSKSLIVGVARRDHTDETYRNFLLENVVCQTDKDCISHARISYYQKDSAAPGALGGLSQLLDAHDTNVGEACERIFYLATSYTVFGGILENIKQAGLLHNAKIVFEKPFGHDYKSAMALEKQIHAVFSEEQVYRIDHYLGKETVQNINVLKFANPLIAAVMSNKFIDHIEVFSDETLGVGDRIAYYDGSGATRDMIQSHLLQVLSLVLMDEPKSFSADDIHDAKIKVLKTLKLGKTHIVGQYESYLAELHAAKLPTSKTETFSRVHVLSSSPKWSGVDIYLQSGKKLEKKSSKIILYLKKNSHQLGFSGGTENRIIIDIQPGEDIKLYFNTRKPFSKNELVSVNMTFCGNCLFGNNTTDGYKLLLYDVIYGEKTLFTRYDELRYSWKLVDAFLKQKQNLPLHVYKDGANVFSIIGNLKW
jgi:glucose-6-phosphate 1-dehydrogenase